MRILVTGAAGFIGFHTAKRLLKSNHVVVGIDNISDYYDPSLKRSRLNQLYPMTQFSFHRIDVADKGSLEKVFEDNQFDRVIHLAAQAGVRHASEHIDAYVQSNLVGFVNILEACRISRTPHLVFASSSSVYGANAKLPFSEHDGVDHPISLYSATKRANELMAHSYAHLYGLPATGLRLFTVYGPWGRPDMAYYAFTRNILTGEPIEVFNHGRHRRDFTYIDDVVGRVVSVMDEVPQPNEDWNPQEPDPATSNAPFRLYNIGNGQPVYVDDLIAAIETAAGKKATRLNLEMQPEDMLETWADCSDLDALYEDIPATDIADGVTRFVRWFKDYHGHD